MGLLERFARLPALKANLIVGAIASVPVLGYAVYLQRKALRPGEWTQRREGVAEIGGTYTLVDHFGRPKTQADFYGTWPLMYFGFTHCPDVCPQQLDRLGEALELVKNARPEARLSPMFLCCDAGRDSVAACKRITSEFHPDIVGMTGTAKQVKDLTRKYKVFFSEPTQEDIDSGDYIVDHSIATFMFDPQGVFVEYWSSNHSAEEVAARIIKEIDLWQTKTRPFG
eukprot:GGOE01061284.1.p1 GENE.GGOE01061284.1~~GGOE01061284.1.p1  ORF type:complete len:226 (-),score=56.88 GGOE01061284.1:268-945(-)